MKTCSCSKTKHSVAVVAYQLCLKMGDVLGDGTEGNVFIQLFGDKGMTEQIQLRQAGNSKIRFEKGRTYKFTVETVNIGKVRLLWFLLYITVQFSSVKSVVFRRIQWCDFLPAALPAGSSFGRSGQLVIFTWWAWSKAASMFATLSRSIWFLLN